MLQRTLPAGFIVSKKAPDVPGLLVSNKGEA